MNPLSQKVLSGNEICKSEKTVSFWLTHFVIYINRINRMRMKSNFDFDYYSLPLTHRWFFSVTFTLFLYPFQAMQTSYIFHVSLEFKSSHNQPFFWREFKNQNSYQFLLFIRFDRSITMTEKQLVVKKEMIEKEIDDSYHFHPERCKPDCNCAILF